MVKLILGTLIHLVPKGGDKQTIQFFLQFSRSSKKTMPESLFKIDSHLFLTKKKFDRIGTVEITFKIFIEYWSNFQDMPPLKIH